jgi:hypothetical protein
MLVGLVTPSGQCGDLPLQPCGTLYPVTRPPKRPRDFASGRSASSGRGGRSDQVGTRVVSTRQGRARRVAEPLAASWHPVAELEDDETDFESEAERRARHRPRHRQSALRRYGWAVYALPLLVVISALAVFQAVGPPEGGVSAGRAGPRLPAPNVPEAPVATVAPPGQNFAPTMFSAALPPGLPIPEAGARTYDVLPGASPLLGGGDTYKYSVEVEVGVQLPEGNDAFGRFVQETLSDPRSWTNQQSGIGLQRVDANGSSPDFRVTLVSQRTAREVCGFDRGLPFDTSCRIVKGNDDRVYINAARWVRGAVSFQGDNENYRRYSINHEVGHVFGNPHVACPAQGAAAPVMMQQTLSVSNNELHELNQAVSQGATIPANGFVCKPNAWPFPPGGSTG